MIEQHVSDSHNGVSNEVDANLLFAFKASRTFENQFAS